MHGQPTILILTICAMGAGCGGFSAELGSVPDAAVQVDQTNIPVLHQDLGLPPADVEPHPPDLVPLDVASDLMPDAQAPDLKPDAPAGRLVNTLAGSGAYGHVDGPAAIARFAEPRGVAVDGQGRVFVADTGNHCIRMIHQGQVTTYAGSLSKGYLDGKVGLSRFNAPRGLAADAQGRVLVADTDNHLIRVIEAGQVTTVAGTSWGFKDGPASQARFRYPYDLALDTSSMIYVADHGNHAVRVILAGQVVTVAGDGWPGFKDGMVNTARFFYPGSVAVAPSGDVYVSDTGNNRVRHISGGQVITLCGSNHGFKDGSQSVAKFRYPRGLAVLGSDLYVADTSNHRVRLVTGGQVTTYAGQGTPNYADGHHSVAMFNNPYSLAVDSAGRVLVADATNNRIRIIEP